MLVVDASVLVVALVDDDDDGDRARQRLRGETLVAPEVVDLEVVSVLRRLTATGAVPARRAALALADLVELPMERAPHERLLPRVWELRTTLAPYDAAYVALAEAVVCPLLTADARLSAAPGPRCTIEVFS